MATTVKSDGFINPPLLMNARHVAVKIGTGVVGTVQKEFDQRVAVLALEITEPECGIVTLF